MVRLELAFRLRIFGRSIIHSNYNDDINNNNNNNYNNRNHFP